LLLPGLAVVLSQLALGRLGIWRTVQTPTPGSRFTHNNVRASSNELFDDFPPCTSFSAHTHVNTAQMLCCQRVHVITFSSVCELDMWIHSCRIIQQKYEGIWVLESKWDPIRKKLARRLIQEQDKVLRSYFAEKGWARSKWGDMGKCNGREHVRFDIYV
jgi:hypothetical protein